MIGFERLTFQAKQIQNIPNIIVCLLLLTVSSVPAMAQESDAQTKSESSVDASGGEPISYQEDLYQERLALSRELHDVRRIKDKILNDIDNIANSLPVVERDGFERYIESNINFDELEQDSIKIVADLYTVPELKAMLAYFGSKEGRAAEAKSAQYGDVFGKKLQEQIDKAMMAAKFDSAGQGAASNPAMQFFAK